MIINDDSVHTGLNRLGHKAWILCCVALISAAAASFVTARVLANATDVKTDSGRVFELEIYHAVPGKAPALESRFRDASKLQTKHGLNVMGYWVPSGDPAWDNTFIYLVAHASRDAATRNWKRFHADPEFQKYVKSEQAEPLIESVDTVYMHPTDYSGMK